MLFKHKNKTTIISRDYNLKKAAMFGLDARIALVVISVLSILSGVKLYQLLNTVDVKNVAFDMASIGVAIDDYHKDMNKSIIDTLSGSLTAAEKESAAFKALYENSNIASPYNSKWHGPYITSSYKNDNISFFDAEIKIVRLSSALSTTCNNVKNNPCYIFIKLEDIANNYCEMFEDLENKENLTKVSRQSGSDASHCDILFNVALDY